MKAAFYICFALLMICFAGMAVSAVLVDHGLASRLAFDLFGILGLVFGLPSLIFGWASNE